MEAVAHPHHHRKSQSPAITRIKVVGVGDAGCEYVGRMSNHNLPGVHYVMVNPDVQSMEPAEHVSKTIRLGHKILRGWGVGGGVPADNPAAQDSAAEIREALRDAELLFITAGMGGSGTEPVAHLACLAREAGSLVVGVVTTPFSFEGSRRIGEAISGVTRLRECVDNLIVIHGDRLLQFGGQDAEIAEAFQIADEVVTQGILSISELLNDPNGTWLEFADVRTVLAYRGGALMALGLGRGPGAPIEAARQAIANPLLNLPINGAKGLIFSVKGGPDLTVSRATAASDLIARSVDNKARILFGMSIDEDLEDEVKLTLIATGL